MIDLATIFRTPIALPTLCAVGLFALGAIVMALARSRGAAHGGQLFAVTAPEVRGAPEQFFAALHGLLRPAIRRLVEGQPWISLELGGAEGRARFYIFIPTGQEPFVEDLLRAAWPGVELAPVTDDPLAAVSAGALACARVTLARSSFLPLRTKIDGDTLAPLLGALSRPHGGERIHVSLLVRPRSSRWTKDARARAQGLRAGRRNLLAEALLPGPARARSASAHELEQARLIEEKTRHLGFDCVLRVVTAADTEITARELLRSVAAALRVFDGPNGFAFKRVLRRETFYANALARAFPARGSFVLNTEELASLWHLPREAPPHVEAIRSPKLPAPQDVPRTGRVLGVTNYAGHVRPVALSVEDSRRHLHVLGPTGTGKTTLLLTLALQDLAAGRGVGIIDPKGDLVEAVLARLPRERARDVVLITPDETGLSVGMNPLEWSDPEDRDLIADNVLAIFKRLYAAHWGMRTDDILKSALMTLLARPDNTLCSIPPLLTDPSFRARALERIDDPIGLGGFWRWYEGLTDAQRSEAISPVLNKLRDFLLRGRIRRLLCQPRSTVDLARIIDGGGVLLANLSTGRWGEETASLLGSFLVSKLWQAVRARSGIPEDQRRDFFLYVDEFQQFVGVAGSFADTLAQARSYRLSLTLANQHFGQLPRELREAVSSNARSRIVFQCGPDDARTLAREFAPLSAEALQSLPRHEMAVRLSVAGETTRPFTARALPPAGTPNPGLAAEVARASRERFGRPAAEIDAQLAATILPQRATAPDSRVGRRPRT